LPVVALALGRWRVQIQPQGLLLARLLLLEAGALRKAVGRRPVSPHVTAQGLADGELEPADGALMDPRPCEFLTPVPGEPRLLVAGPVASESLEGREPAAAGLALENSVCRGCARRDVDDLLSVAAAEREENKDISHVHARRLSFLPFCISLH
ncbi:unnamed protein product, partial [Musa hybrid cultivar]